jgi:hypothetical protein
MIWLLLISAVKDLSAKNIAIISRVLTAKIREVARVLGLIVSSFSAVDHARLYYREIEKAKFIALIKSCGNFDAPMKITSNMREELNWWFTCFVLLLTTCHLF